MRVFEFNSISLIRKADFNSNTIYTGYPKKNILGCLGKAVFVYKIIGILGVLILFSLTVIVYIIHRLHQIM